MSENCLFCKIIKGEIPSKKIYEDDDVFAFYDIAPQAPVEGGARFVFNCKADAGQTVFHIHLHVVGGQQMGWPPFPKD